MSLELYSYLLSISVLALGSVTLMTLIAYLSSATVRTKLQNIPYFHIVKFIGFLAIFSTI